MQLTRVFHTLLLASAVSAGNNGNSTSTKSQCKQIFKLTALVDLATNDTRLAEHFENNTTAIDGLKAKVPELETKLKDLSSNATLTEECASIQAHFQQVQACGQIKHAERLIALAANDTALQEKFNGNATKIEAFKSKVAGAQTELTSLQSNTTLTGFCAAQQDMKACSSMAKLQKEVAMSNNQTALDAKFNGDTAKIDAFKAKAIKAQAKLDAMTANSTLTDVCSTLSQAETNQKGTTKESTSVQSRAVGSLFTIAFAAITSGALML